ncbi:Protein transport protein [Dirofilaria immitis]
MEAVYFISFLFYILTPKISINAVRLNDQNHGDFVGFNDITLINWEEMECAADSKAVICDQRPVELYGKIMWKSCLFGYICIKKSDYVDEFRRCIDLGDNFNPVLCNSAYEYPRNFNCDFYDKFSCHRSKRYVYSCICINNHRNADMQTCVNTTVCNKGLPEKEIISTSMKILKRRSIHTTTTTVKRIFHRSTRIQDSEVKPKKKCQPGSYLSAILKTIFFYLISVKLLL